MTARLIMKLHVDAAAPVAHDVVRLTLVHRLRPTLPRWKPGAHVDLHLPDGLIRQYSLCGSAEDLTRYEIAIKRVANGRGGSRWAYDNLRLGSIAHVSAPRDNFGLTAGATEHVLVAGGIGVTPLASMARTLASAGSAFHLHFCARSPETAPLLGDLRDICGSRLTCWFSSAGNRFSPLALGPPRPGAHAYVCGPQGLVDATEAALVLQGWPDEQRHVERFTNVIDENFQPEPFDVEIASTGAVLHVPADFSLLSVLQTYGFTVPSSCESGVCGSCECRYWSGIVIHRDTILSPTARQDRMTPCVSRARSRILLDL